MSGHLLAALLGKHFLAAHAAVHRFGSKESPNPVALWLTFSDVGAFRFASAPDGSSLLVDREPPNEADMGESGSIVLVDWTAAEPAAPAIGKLVRSVRDITNIEQGDVLGVRIDLDSVVLRIINWGDDLFIGSGFPPGSGLGEFREDSVA